MNSKSTTSAKNRISPNQIHPKEVTKSHPENEDDIQVEF